MAETREGKPPMVLDMSELERLKLDAGEPVIAEDAPLALSETMVPAMAETGPAYKCAGILIVKFVDQDGILVPYVECNPVGRINPATIDRALPTIYKEIIRAQSEERRRHGR